MRKQESRINSIEKKDMVKLQCPESSVFPAASKSGPRLPHTFVLVFNQLYFDRTSVRGADLESKSRGTDSRGISRQHRVSLVINIVNGREDKRVRNSNSFLCVFSPERMHVPRIGV